MVRECKQQMVVPAVSNFKSARRSFPANGPNSDPTLD